MSGRLPFNEVSVTVAQAFCIRSFIDKITKGARMHG